MKSKIPVYTMQFAEEEGLEVFCICPVCKTKDIPVKKVEENEYSATCHKCKSTSKFELEF